MNTTHAPSHRAFSLSPLGLGQRSRERRAARFPTAPALAQLAQQVLQNAFRFAAPLSLIRRITPEAAWIQARSASVFSPDRPL